MDYLSGRIPLYLRIEQIELSVTDSAGDKRKRDEGKEEDGKTSEGRRREGRGGG